MYLATLLLIAAAEPLSAPEPEPAHWPHRVLGTNVVVDTGGHDDFDGGTPANSEGPFTLCTLSADAAGQPERIHLVSTPVGPNFRPPTPVQLSEHLDVRLADNGRQRYRCFTEARWSDARAAIDNLRGEREQVGEILWEIFWPAELLDQ